MKKIIVSALFVPMVAIAQTFPSPTFNSLTLQNPLTPANGGTGSATSTGSGSVVLSNSPTLVTPALGTPSSVILTNGSGLPISTGVSGLGTGVAAGLANAATGSGSPVLATSPTIASPTVTGAFTATGLVTTADLATQSANTVLANVTGSTASPSAFAMPSCSAANSALYYTSGTGFGCRTNTALTSGNLSQFAATTSAQLAGIISDETGSGALVFGTSPTISSPTISGGTINNASIGVTTPAAGKFTTLATTGALTQPSTGQFYQNLGANVNRSNDRLFVGAATVQDGTLAGTQDYVSQNIPQGPTTAISQTASYSTQGSVGLIAASRSSDAPNSGTEGSIGVMGVAVNDASGANQQVGFASYFEAQQKTGAGFTAAIENDTVNQSGVVSPITPYSFFAGNPIVNLWTAAGGARSGVTNSSAAMAVLANGAVFDKGIVFQSGSLASNEALALASGQAIQWWGNSSTPTGGLSSIQTTSNAGIVMTDTGIAIGNVPSPAFTGGLFVNTIANATNYVTVTPEPTGFGPVISSSGGDANSGLILNGKGNSGAILQGITSGNAAPAGYVGQLLTNSAAGVSLTNSSAANLTTISLTPGSWDLQCNAEFVPAGSTTVNQIAAGVGTTSQSLGTVGQLTYLQASFSTGAAQYVATPTYRVNVGSNTTAYCVGFSVFGASTMTGSALFRATRVN